MTVHGVAKSQTRLSGWRVCTHTHTHTHTHTYINAVRPGSDWGGWTLECVALMGLCPLIMSLQHSD